MLGLGTSTFKVTARDEQARAWFAQGLLLTYAFEHGEATRVFRAALARDPDARFLLDRLQHTYRRRLSLTQRLLQA